MLCICIIAKKGLTKIRGFGILYKLSARETLRERKRDSANLENDTENERNHPDDCEDQSRDWERERGGERVRDPRTVRFEELNAI